MNTDFQTSTALKKLCSFSAFISLCMTVVSVKALTIIDQDTAIDGTNVTERYKVINRATLTAVDATTWSLNAEESGTGLQLNRTRVTIPQGGDGTGNRFAVNGRGVLIDSQVNNGNSGTQAALQAIHGSLQLVGTQVTSVTSGLQIANDATASMIGGGIDVQGIAVLLLGNSFEARGSTIKGGSGITLINDGLSGPGLRELALAGTEVIATQGPAIQIGYAGLPSAAVNVGLSDGTTLTGSDGVAIQVANGNDARVTVQRASITGDYIVEAGGSGRLTLGDAGQWTGRLTNVAQVNIAAGGQWNLVEDARLQTLALSGGTVSFGQGGNARILEVGELSGSGTFQMHADFANDTSDLLNITGTSEGEHQLRIRASGTDAATGNPLQVVHTQDGRAQFELTHGHVDVGAYQYALEQDGNDWYLRQTTELSDSAASALALFNAMPTVWYGEMTPLRSRLDQLRLGGGATGGWVRSYGSKYTVAAGNGLGYRQYQQGFALGADAPAPWGDGQWLVGLTAGYSQSKLNQNAGTSGQIDSFSIGGYLTWLDQDSGLYFNSVAKAGQLRSKADVAMSDDTRAHGRFDTLGLGMTVELGRHLALAGDYFIEPYTQWSALYVKGRDFELDNGMAVQGGPGRSVQGKLGTTFGRTVALASGSSLQPYVRLALANEFARDNRVVINGNRFDNDLAGTRTELGVGAVGTLSSSLQLQGTLEYSHGEKIEQPWGVNLGLRYHW